MLDWHSCQLCYSLEIKILSLLLMVHVYEKLHEINVAYSIITLAEFNISFDTTVFKNERKKDRKRSKVKLKLNYLHLFQLPCA